MSEIVKAFLNILQTPISVILSFLCTETIHLTPSRSIQIPNLTFNIFIFVDNEVSMGKCLIGRPDI